MYYIRRGKKSEIISRFISMFFVKKLGMENDVVRERSELVESSHSIPLGGIVS